MEQKWLGQVAPSTLKLANLHLLALRRNDSKFLQPRQFDVMMKKMLKTRVSKSKRFDKQLKGAPNYIQTKVHLWILELGICGISKTRERAGYHDEPLAGTRKGQRSIRLNRNYRLIYKELEKGVHIYLLEVNHHDY